MADTPSPIVLPRSHVLSYVTATNTPTRVRTVAFIATLTVGILNALAILPPALYLYHRFRDELRWWGGGGGPALAPVSPSEYIKITIDIFKFDEYYQFSATLSLLALLSSLFSPLLIITAKAIHRGHRTPALLTRAYLLVPIIQLLVFAAAYNGWALVGSLRFFNGNDPENLIRLFSLPFFTLAVLLLIDLRSYLRWIAYNPVTEKPPTPFLPGTSR